MFLKIEHTLEKDSISCLANKNKITTDLKREKLAKEMSNTVDDETSRLFNSVSHVQQSIRSTGVNENAEDDGSPHGIVHMDSEFEMEDPEAAMNSFQVDDEIAETTGEDKEGEVGLDKNCFSDIWYKGWEAILKMNAKKIKMREKKRLEKKKKSQRTILEKVKQMKDASAESVKIDDENGTHIDAMWTVAVHALDSIRYKD